VIIISIINFLLWITHTCNAETWNGVIESSSQICCCRQVITVGTLATLWAGADASLKGVDVSTLLGQV